MASEAPLDDQTAFMEWLVARVGSQAELARRSELLSETISDYVRGENEPKLTNVLKMLRGAGVRIEGMPDQPDLTAETVALLRRLEAYLEMHDGEDRPPTAAEGP